MTMQIAHGRAVGLILCLLATAAIGSAAMAQTPVASTKRPMRVEDLPYFADEGLRSFATSPDGKVIAFVRRRAINAMPPWQRTWFVAEQARDDIWVQEAPGKVARNLTNCVKDGCGAWGASWSPDGERMLFLSSRGGSVTPWVWERSTGKVRQVAKQGVNYVATADQGCWWSAAGRGFERLWCYTPPPGEAARIGGAAQITRRVDSVWTAADRGEVTASALDSRVFRFPHAGVVSIDVRTGVVTNIGVTAPSSVTMMGPLWLSPTGEIVAFADTQSSEYGRQILARLGHPRKVVLRRADGSPVRLERELPNNVLMTTLHWSPSGKELLFFAYGDTKISPFVLFGSAAAEVMPDRDAPLTNPAKLWRVNVQTGQVQQVPTGDLNTGFLSAPAYAQTANGELLFRTFRDERLNWLPRAAAFGDPNAPWKLPEENWVVLGADGRTRSLDADLRSLPASSVAKMEHLPGLLVSILGGKTFVGLADGEVWQIDPTHKYSRCLTESLTVKVTEFLPLDLDPPAKYPLPDIRVSRSASPIAIIGTSEKKRFSLNLASGEITPIGDAPGANIVEYANGTAVYVKNTPEGTWLWRVPKPGTSAELLAETNLYRNDIIKTRTQIIEYVDQNGTKAKSVVVFPLGYVQGRRYPLVVSQYPVTRTSFTSFTDWLSDADVYAAAGYAVLNPSVNTNYPGMREEEGTMAMGALSASILPAVDKVVELGIADPQRVFVEGVSRGGWSTAALITQTSRFRAAVARAGIFNDGQTFSMSIGRRYPYDRYGEHPLHGFSMPQAVNRGYYPSDVPWCRDGERIHRNSPLWWADRIQTPLMLMHGDLDAAVDIIESEDMFRALSSMRKTAQFVRYWGEGHWMANPANERDRFQRIFAWFDQHGDILRDAQGNLVFDGDRVKSRGDAPALLPAAFARFGPTASEAVGAVQAGVTSSGNAAKKQ